MKNYPFHKNSCAGYFKDWLEVYLIDKCNGSCSWCIEKEGYKPSYHAPWDVLVDAVLKTDRKNICLLGGEPTLYPELKLLIRELKENGRNVYLTTNGSKLSGTFVEKCLTGLAGLNISIHSHFLSKNEEITGIWLLWDNLREAVDALHCNGGTVRLNCNCIRGYIDNFISVLNYIGFAKQLRVNSVRFAELKGNADHFVSLAKIMPKLYKLNEDPFVLGCHHEDIIDGMPVSFKQMCGCQTPCRPIPVNPVQISNPVLYYDGKIYNGWQRTVRKEEMKKTADTKVPKVDVDHELVKILTDFSEQSLNMTETALKIDRLYRDLHKTVVEEMRKKLTDDFSRTEGVGCTY